MCLNEYIKVDPEFISGSKHKSNIEF